jgi:hypothetical protein
MAEQLANLLKTDLPAGSIGYKATIGTQEPFISRKEELQKGITEAEGDIAKATQAQAETREAGKLKAQEAFGTAEKGAMQQYQGKLEAEPLPAFIPTKDSAQDLAGLFSLVNVVGMIAGKGDAQRALGAMNGMLEGYQKGRGDLYKKESAEFDKNFKSMLKKHEEFRKEMEDAIKLATTDKEAGMQAAELAAVKAGSDIVKAQLRKGDLVGAYKLVDETQKGVGEAVKAESQIREKAADRKLAATKASAKGQQTSALLAGRAENIREAFVQAAKDLENVTRFPPGTVLGTFAGMTGLEGRGLTESIANTFARTITDTESRMLQQLVSGLEANLATALGGGYAASASKYRIDMYKAQVPKTGDDGYVAANFLARLKQELNILSDNFASKPGASPEMSQAVYEANNRINKAVPFTVEDVTDAYFAGKQPPTTVAPSTPSASAPTVKSNIDTERERANSAIQRGANAELVKQRFKKETGQEL